MHIFLFVFVNAFTANSTAFSSRAFICISFSTAVHRPWVLFLPRSLFTLLAFSLSLFCSSELRGILAVFSPSSLPEDTASLWQFFALAALSVPAHVEAFWRCLSILSILVVDTILLSTLLSPVEPSCLVWLDTDLIGIALSTPCYFGTYVWQHLLLNGCD